MRKSTSTSLMSLIKGSLFVALAALSFNASAGDNVYVGNPDRPDTIWVPGHCEGGCWQDGYYVKFLQPVTSNDVTWVDGMYDNSGNYIPGHWKVIGNYQYYNYR